MTRLEKIREFFKALSEQLGINFVRTEQSGDRPGHIFMSYKILSGNPEPAQCVIVKQKPLESDDTKLLKTSTRETDLIVSLSFIGAEKDYSALWNYAESAFEWIDSESGMEAADIISIGVSAAGPVQDRTVFLETEYEHKIGFDIRIKDKTSKTETVDAVDLSATIEEIIYS